MSNEKSISDRKIVDAVFARICELYGVSTDADIGRKLGGLSNQSVYTYRKRGTIPYAHIIENLPSGDWEYLFTGRKAPTGPAEGGSDLSRALEIVRAAGFVPMPREAVQPFQGEPIRPET